MVLETILLVTSIASVASTEITSKGITDHAISAVSGRDCKIANTLKGDGICDPRGSVTVAGYSNNINSNPVIEMEKIFARRKEQNNGR